MKHGRVQNLKIRNITGLAIGLGLLFLALNSATALAQVYKWTDENGVTHYSQTPPPSGQEAEIQDLPEYENEIEASPPLGDEAVSAETEELSAADVRRQELAAARQARADEQAATEELCQNIELRLAQIEPSRRVFYTGEDGQTVRMDDEERVAEVQRLKELQSEHCQ